MEIPDMGGKHTAVPDMAEAAPAAREAREKALLAVSGTDPSAGSDSAVSARGRVPDMKKIHIFAPQAIIYVTVITKRPGRRWTIWTAVTGMPDGIITAQ